MKRIARNTALLLILAVVVPLAGQRLAGADFRPAAANEPTATPQPVLATRPIQADPPEDTTPAPVAIEAAVPVTAAEAAADPAPEPAAAPANVAVAPVVVPAPAAVRPVSQVAPAPATPRPTTAPAPTAAPTVAPVATAAPTAPPAATCPATWFCYPRLGIAGAIVPYTDCSGATDVGTSIRSFTCLSPFYLMAHAYTQFGKITQWRAGDIVFASGQQFTITGAFTQSSCAAPAQAIAPLSLQTSLTSGGCGTVLVVQGR